MTLNKYETIIVRKLYQYHRPMTKTQIASQPPYKLSWNTVDKYLETLKEGGYVYPMTKNGKEYWCLNY